MVTQNLFLDSEVWWLPCAVLSDLIKTFQSVKQCASLNKMEKYFLHKYSSIISDVKLHFLRIWTEGKHYELAETVVDILIFRVLEFDLVKMMAGTGHDFIWTNWTLDIFFVQRGEKGKGGVSCLIYHQLLLEHTALHPAII